MAPIYTGAGRGTLELPESRNRGDAGSLVATSEYLEIVITRR